MIFIEDEVVRLEVWKMLVIIIDEKLFGDMVVVKGVVKDLIDNYVFIIIVVFGSEVDCKELEEFIFIDGNFLNVIIDKDLGEIVEEIIGKIV